MNLHMRGLYHKTWNFVTEGIVASELEKQQYFKLII
jgi:hypothetical protein